jgi:hypothetical protein
MTHECVLHYWEITYQYSEENRNRVCLRQLTMLLEIYAAFELDSSVGIVFVTNHFRMNAG